MTKASHSSSPFNILSESAWFSIRATVPVSTVSYQDKVSENTTNKSAQNLRTPYNHRTFRSHDKLCLSMGLTHHVYLPISISI